MNTTKEMQTQKSQLPRYAYVSLQDKNAIENLKNLLFFFDDVGVLTDSWSVRSAVSLSKSESEGLEFIHNNIEKHRAHVISKLKPYERHGNIKLVELRQLSDLNEIRKLDFTKMLVWEEAKNALNSIDEVEVDKIFDSKVDEEIRKLVREKMKRDPTKHEIQQMKEYANKECSGDIEKYKFLSRHISDIVECEFKKDSGYWNITFGIFDQFINEQESQSFKNVFERIRTVLSIEFGMLHVGWNFIPIVSDIDLQPMLYERIMKSFSDDRVRKAYEMYKEEMQIKIDLLVQNIALENVSYPKVKNPEQLIVLREKYKQELNDFNANIRRLSHEISSHPYDADFFPSIKNVVDTKVNPSIVNLRRVLEASKKEFKFNIAYQTAKSLASSSLFLVGGVPDFIPIILSIASKPWKVIEEYMSYKNNARIKRAESSYSLFIR